MLYLPLSVILPLLGIFIFILRHTYVNKILSILGVLFALIVAVIPTEPSNKINYLSLWIQIISPTHLSHFVNFFFGLCLTFSTLFCLSFSKVNYRHISLAFILTGIAMIVMDSQDLVIILILLELIIIVSAFSIALEQNANTRKSSLQFVVVNFLGATLFTFGVDGHIATYGTAHIYSISNLNNYADYFMLAGLLVMIGTPPLGGWLSDSLTNSTSNIATALCTFIPRLCLILLIKIFAGSHVILYIGLVLSAYGIVFSLFTSQFRKILACSITHQAGFVLMVMSCTHDIYQHTALNFFVIVTTLVDVGFFMISALTFYYLGVTNIHKIRGIFKYKKVMKYLTLMLSLSVLVLPYLTFVLLFPYHFNPLFTPQHASAEVYLLFFIIPFFTVHSGLRLFLALCVSKPDEVYQETFAKLQFTYFQQLCVGLIVIALLLSYSAVIILFWRILGWHNLLDVAELLCLSIAIALLFNRFVTKEDDVSISNLNPNVLGLVDKFANKLLLTAHTLYYGSFKLVVRYLRRKVQGNFAPLFTTKAMSLYALLLILITSIVLLFKSFIY